MTHSLPRRGDEAGERVDRRERFMVMAIAAIYLLLAIGAFGVAIAALVDG